MTRATTRTTHEPFTIEKGDDYVMETTKRSAVFTLDPDPTTVKVETPQTLEPQTQRTMPMLTSPELPTVPYYPPELSDTSLFTFRLTNCWVCL